MNKSINLSSTDQLLFSPKFSARPLTNHWAATIIQNMDMLNNRKIFLPRSTSKHFLELLSDKSIERHCALSYCKTSVFILYRQIIFPSGHDAQIVFKRQNVRLFIPIIQIYRLNEQVLQTDLYIFGILVLRRHKIIILHFSLCLRSVFVCIAYKLVF